MPDLTIELEVCSRTKAGQRPVIVCDEAYQMATIDDPDPQDIVFYESLRPTLRVTGTLEICP